MSRQDREPGLPLRRRREGRNEQILEPELPIVDSHHHLYDRPPVRYMFEEYLEDARAGHNLLASVYVETLAMARARGPEILRPLGEVEFANGIGAMSESGGYGQCKVAAAIVGFADLAVGDLAASLLDRCIGAAPDRYRGVRQITIEHPSEVPFKYMINRPRPGVLNSDEFRAGFRLLRSRDLSFDAAVFDHQLPDLARLAGEFPETPIILNHMGLAMAMEMSAEQRSEVFYRWRRGMLTLAEHENVTCKIGGLGLPFWGFGFEVSAEVLDSRRLADAWRPYVETAIEAFGVERCMTESNYPPDSRSCGFVPLWNALKTIFRDYSSAEKVEIFSGTAARVYRIEI